MLVEAIRLGFYDGQRVRPGTKFYLMDDKHFSNKWMKLVNDSKLERVEKVVEEKVVDNKKNKRASDKDVI